MKTLKNKFPCCQKPTGIHHDNWSDDDVLERACPRCGTMYVIEFERVEPFRGLGEFRKLHFTKKERNGHSRGDA